ncbi:sunset domain-containing protein [Deinococcus aquiradiocola]|uniref:HNH endonuclease n=1 Tax=Deinococcus aquiradiocola TaxID=393059 RepID=A0A917PPD6_9DEIO|nr:hypothetical protein [Deinococcus aquiradiocola]GGJ86939.1 hypothetical protein GCM10008939_33670 [Deinococcus aquiradiocola]
MRSLSALLLLALSPAALAINLNAPLNPDPVRTPGDVLTSDPRVVCVSGYTKTVRNVPQALKEQVYRSYGITSRESGEYEIDHLISLELGGSNSVRNLWPESYKTNPLNAHVKDTLENKLHALACSGKITLQQAQQAIASNWQAAYVQYVGPLPGGVTPPPAPKPGQTSGAATVPVLPTSTPPSPPVAATTPVPAPTAASVAPSGGACPASAPIKGNIGSNGKIYHLPQGDPNYRRTHAEACFTTPAAAQSAGFRAAR